MVALLALAVFGNTLANQFALDDVPLVRNNPDIASVANIPRLFVSEYWAHLKAGAGLYRPLVLTSFTVDNAVLGPEPWGHHLVNVVLHAANCMLVLLLFRRLSDDRAAVAAGALLFAVHAVHTEAVAPLSGRAELLCAGFFLVALLAYARFTEEEGSPAAYLLSLVAFALSLLSKETGATLLGVVLLFDFVYTDGGPRRRLLARLGWLLRGPRVARYAGFAAVLLAYAVLRFWILEIAGPRGTTPRLDNPLLYLDFPWDRVSALLVAHRYVGLLLLPLHLAYDYSADQIRLIRSVSDPRFLLVVAGSAAALWLWLRSWRWSRPLFFALGFGLVTFSIGSNLVVGIGTIMAERLLYLPSVGFCLALPLGARLALGRVSPEIGRRVFAAVFAALVVFNALRALDRNRDWFDDDTLMLHDLALSPRSAKVQANAGVTLINLDRKAEAVAHLQASIAIYPEPPEPHGLLGNALLATGREDEAIEAYEEAIARGTTEAYVWNNLGYLLVERGDDVERGVRMIRAAVEKEPEVPAFLDSLGWVEFKLGRPREARAWVARAVQIEPNPTRREHLAAIDHALGEAGDAMPR